MASLDRLSWNQALIREVNERIKDLAEQLDGRVSFLCECGDENCSACVLLTLADYESLRAMRTWFLVASGHERSELGRVVEERDGFTVVETLVTAPIEPTKPRVDDRPGT